MLRKEAFAIFSVTRRSKSDVGESFTQSVSVSIDFKLITDVTLVSANTDDPDKSDE